MIPDFKLLLLDRHDWVFHIKVASEPITRLIIVEALQEVIGASGRRYGYEDFAHKHQETYKNNHQSHDGAVRYRRCDNRTCPHPSTHIDRQW